jgi:F-type H+-transporting ATPase subunit b
MLTAIVTQTGDQVQVRLVSSETTDTTMPEAVLMSASAEAGAAETTVAEVKTPPNPVNPAKNEMLWAAGAFLVLFVLMRYFLFPRLKKSTDARYASIRANSEGAEQVKVDAKSDVAEYEKALDAARAEAAGRVDAARQTVDNERTAQLAQVNGRIAAARADADQKNAAARAAAQGDVAAAVATVASRVAELALGKAPDASVVNAAVASTMEGSRS